MCLADYDSYLNVYNRVLRTYADEEAWTKKSLLNIAGAGFFSSDRSIREYADNIWHTSPIK
jgi:starch phosphorylase